MKYHLTLAVAAVAMVVPTAVSAQEVDEERVQYLTCRLADVCGEVAEADQENDVVAIDSIPIRGPGTVFGLDDIGVPSSRTPKSTATKATSSSSKSTGTRLAATGGRGTKAGTAIAPKAEFAPAIAVPEDLKGKADLFVTFELNSARLTRDAKKDIDNLAEAIRRADAGGKKLRYRIAGHTDSSGSDDINEQLSADRAAAVRTALIEAGVDGARLESTGYGSREPVEGYDKSHGINRRVEAVVISE